MKNAGVLRRRHPCDAFTIFRSRDCSGDFEHWRFAAGQQSVAALAGQVFLGPEKPTELRFDPCLNLLALGLESAHQTSNDQFTANYSVLRENRKDFCSSMRRLLRPLLEQQSSVGPAEAERI